MSVTLMEVLEKSDYHILTNLDDAKWFKSKQSESESLFEQVDDFIDNSEVEEEEDEE